MKEITVWDLADTKLEPDGYDMTEVPDVSARNISALIQKVNELVREVNRLNSLIPAAHQREEEGWRR